MLIIRLLNVDNQCCIALSRHPVHHSEKGFETKTHDLQDLREKGIVLNYVETETMPADIRTKLLQTNKFEQKMMIKTFLLNS